MLNNRRCIGMYVSVLILCSVLGCSNAGKPPVDDRSVHTEQTRSNNASRSPRFVDWTLRVPFKLVGDAKLVIADPDSGGGMPVEAFQSMWLVFPKNQKSILVKRLAALRGHVQLRSPAEALAFCRLTTSPATFFSFEGEVEVILRDHVTLSLCFGNVERCRLFRKLSYTNGVESNGTMRSIGVSPATARAVGNLFEIKRTILVPSSGSKPKLVSVIETVTQNGNYIRKIVRERYAPEGFLVPYFL